MLLPLRHASSSSLLLLYKASGNLRVSIAPLPVCWKIPARQQTGGLDNNHSEDGSGSSRLEPGMRPRTSVTSVNFRLLLTFPRLSHTDCFLYFLSLWRLFLFIVGFVFPVSTPCFSIFKAHYPESHSLPFQSRANIHESYVLQEKEQAGGGSGREEMLLPLLVVFACVPTTCLFSTQQVGMSLFEKTDLGLRKSRKELSTFIWRPGFALSLDITEAKLESLWVDVGALRVSSGTETKVLK